MSHTTYKLYLVRHVATGKEYVGVTTMKVAYRMSAHRTYGPMSQLMLEEGMGAFSWCVLKWFDSKEDALEAESKEILSRNCHEPNGFNRLVRGGKYPGRCGNHLKGNTFSRRTEVLQVANDGKDVVAYCTVVDAAKKSGVDRAAIHRSLRKPTLRAGGFFWKRVAIGNRNGG